jgi:hypothetical protein
MCCVPPRTLRWKNEVNRIVYFESLLPAEDGIGLRGTLSQLHEFGVYGFLPIASVEFGSKDILLSYCEGDDGVSLAVNVDDDTRPPSIIRLWQSFADFACNVFVIPTVHCPVEELGRRGGPFDLADFLADGNFIDAVSKNDFTLINEAIRFSNVAMIQACIDNGANLSKTLHQSVTLRTPEILQLLVNAGANVNEQDDYGYRPLHYVGGTALGGQEGDNNREVKRLLIASGAKEWRKL